MATVTIGRVGPTVAGSVALASTVLAAATIWLVLSDPGTITSALAEGSVEHLCRSVLEAVGAAIGRLLRWM
jgi:hypothetical protein